MVLEPLRRTAADARAFAYAVHKGQVDKAGRPYTTHLVMVHERLVGKLPGLPHELWDKAQQISWLHDVIEDTEYTADDLRAEGFSWTVIHGVMALTKHGTGSYMDTINRIAFFEDLHTILVKIADVEDNSDPARLALLPAEIRARLEKKYGAALPVLKAAAERLGWKEERS